MSEGSNAAPRMSWQAMGRSVWRPLEILRGRLLVLLVLASAALILLSAAIAWQDQRAMGRAALGHVAGALAAVLARHEAAAEAARHYLTAVAALPGMAAADTPAGCPAALAQAWRLHPPHMTNLALLDAAGQVGCAAAPTNGWPAPLRPTGADAALSVRPGSGVRLLLAAPRAGGGGVAGELALDWLGGPDGGIAMWLIDGDALLALGDAPPGMRPAPDGLTKARRAAAQVASAAFTGAGQDGQPYAYAVAGDGLRLLVAEPVSADLAATSAMLLQGFAALALLVVLALIGMALGAHEVVAQPIEHLSQSVRRWQGGAPFEGAPRDGLPRELADLSNSFAQATQTLAERERQLRGAVAQQELLMQEIHHRVKNNLQIVASLLNLQASRIRQPEARREFQSARDRIRALATLHRHLYAHGDLHTINMRSFLHELCGQLLHALGEADVDRIRLTIEAPELQISSDQAVPMALIVTEVVSNAAKYAFPGSRVGHIAVQLTTDGAKARLVIRDDGVGLPAGQGEAAGGRRDGIGLHLIHGFARQLGGELTVTQDRGTCYDLSLTLHRERDSAPPPPA